MAFQFLPIQTVNNQRVYEISLQSADIQSQWLDRISISTLTEVQLNELDASAAALDPDDENSARLQRRLRNVRGSQSYRFAERYERQRRQHLAQREQDKKAENRRTYVTSLVALLGIFLLLVAGIIPYAFFPIYTCEGQPVETRGGENIFGWVAIAFIFTVTLLVYIFCLYPLK